MVKYFSYQNKFHRIFLLIFLGVFFPSRGQAANLDQIYSPLLGPKQWIYNLTGSNFTMWQKGHHGSASFDRFNLNPSISSVLNSLRYSPNHKWDVRFAYNTSAQEHFNLSTRNNSDVVTSHQEYTLRAFHEFSLDVRLRGLQNEYYLDVNEKRYSTDWNFASSPTGIPSFFNYIQSNFEDIKLGGRFLNKSELESTSLFERPLLSENQWNSQWELGFKNGRLNRAGTFYVADVQHRNYQHRTKPHFIPNIEVRYGIKSNLELESGFSYTSPVEYIYDFRQYKNSGLTNFINGTYSWNNNITLPLKLRYRPSSNIQIVSSIDYHSIQQNFESWEKAENGTVTNYPSKELTYYNLKPALELDLISSPVKIKESQPIETITKNLLSRHQTAFTIGIARDITSLKKNGPNNAQNIVDPYNVYLYPVENFTAGSEYAAFFSGNTALTPANVSPQNFLELVTRLRYGVTDRWEIGLETGYRSPSNLHQYSLNDKSDRYYIFKDYYYVRFNMDLVTTKNSLLALNIKFVPDYHTSMIASNQPQPFNANARYIETSVSFQKSF